MARQFGLPVGTQRLEIPPALGSGFCQYYQLPYQVQCHHYQYKQYKISQRLEVIGENEVEDGLYMVHINLSNSILNRHLLLSA